MENLWKSIQIDRPFYLPKSVKKALERLLRSGYLAYVVGGSVRDFLIGRESQDHDIVSNAHPDILCQLFPQAIPVGKAFGVIMVPVHESGYEGSFIEIATFRKDLEYQDHRHPTGVEFLASVQLAEDAFRRDFTMNALYFDPIRKEILDFTGGLEDIQKKWIRIIGDPKKRFQEDALRLMRAIRFKVILDFDLTADTKQGIRAQAKWITKVSQERIRSELTLMWMSPRPYEALEDLSDLCLLEFILPEAQEIRNDPDLWRQLKTGWIYLVQKKPVRSYGLSWAFIFYFFLKISGLDRVKHRLQALKMSRLEMALILERLEKPIISFKDISKLSEATLIRLLRKPAFEDSLTLYEVDCRASGKSLSDFEWLVQRFEKMKETAFLPLKNFLRGADLIHLGFTPGPKFSQILFMVEDLILENKLRSKEEVIDYVKKHFSPT